MSWDISTSHCSHCSFSSGAAAFLIKKLIQSWKERSFGGGAVLIRLTRALGGSVEPMCPLLLFLPQVPVCSSPSSVSLSCSWVHFAECGQLAFERKKGRVAVTEHAQLFSPVALLASEVGIRLVVLGRGLNGTD